MEIIIRNEVFEKFNPRVSLKNTVPFFIVLGLFLISGLWVGIGMKEYEYGLYFLGFWLFLSVLFLTNVLPVNSCYGMNHTNLLLKRLYSVRLIPWSTVAEVTLLDEKSVEKIMMDLQQEEFEKAYGRLDFGGAFRSRIAMGNFIKYCTVPIVFSGTKQGNALFIKNRKVDTSGEFILMRTKENKKYLLSPEDVRSFIEKVRVYLH